MLSINETLLIEVWLPATRQWVKAQLGQIETGDIVKVFSPRDGEPVLHKGFPLSKLSRILPFMLIRIKKSYLYEQTYQNQNCTKSCNRSW